MPNAADVLLTDATNPTRIRLVLTDSEQAWRESLIESAQSWLDRQRFRAKPGQVAWLEDAEGPLVAVGWNGRDDLATLGGLPMTLPEGDYQLLDAVTELQLLGWALGAYLFTRYKDPTRSPARLALADNQPLDRIVNTAEATSLTRDLINTAAQDMDPQNLAAEIEALARTHNAECSVISGDALLDAGCGAIHAVGRAADAEPCLVDLLWGDRAHPKVTIIGKGVTFDSGGLDLKPAQGMRLMKKDMGGAATAIGLAHLIMAERLPVRLRLLIPAAENAVSGNAFRPGDVLHTHKGLTVEIDNTDAEGRLLLCDALSIASEDEPDLIVDYATLTGSARSAVGSEIAAMFSNNDEIANGISEQAATNDDPVWRLPLHQDYNHMLDSKVADVVNSAASPFAGSITAALFLERFVESTPWVHFDIMAFNTRNRPARPEGGEAMALRAVFQFLKARYGDA